MCMIGENGRGLLLMLMKLDVEEAMKLFSWMSVDDIEWMMRALKIQMWQFSDTMAPARSNHNNRWSFLINKPYHLLPLSLTIADSMTYLKRYCLPRVNDEQVFFAQPWGTTQDHEIYQCLKEPKTTISFWYWYLTVNDVAIWIVYKRNKRNPWSPPWLIVSIPYILLHPQKVSMQMNNSSIFPVLQRVVHHQHTFG